MKIRRLIRFIAGTILIILFAVGCKKATNTNTNTNIATSNVNASANVRLI